MCQKGLNKQSRRSNLSDYGLPSSDVTISENQHFILKQKEKRVLTLCVRETPKRVLLQRVKMLHFNWVYTVCKGKKRSTDRRVLYFLKIITWHPRYVEWTIPSLLYHTGRKNPLVYKGLNFRTFTIIFFSCSGSYTVSDFGANDMSSFQSCIESLYLYDIINAN